MNRLLNENRMIYQMNFARPRLPIDVSGNDDVESFDASDLQPRNIPPGEALHLIFLLLLLLLQRLLVLLDAVRAQ
jgi:hypothetical protein